MALVEVKMKPPLTSHSAPCTLGGRRRSQSNIPSSPGSCALRAVVQAMPLGIEVGAAVEMVDQAHRGISSIFYRSPRIA